MESRFDLNKEVAAWRQFQARGHRFLEEDLDELEVHLRAHIADLQKNGLSQEAAFNDAVQSLGNLEETATEYRKVHLGKLRHRHKLTDELRWRGSMLKNYIKVAFRALRRQKGYSFLNIAGLSVGLACALLIALWIQDELSYDRFHQNGDRIYQVRRHVQFNSDQIYTQQSVPWPLASALEENYSEVEEVVLIREPRRFSVSQNENSTREIGLYAGPAFFEMFSWGLIQGEDKMVLQDPMSVVLSVSLAKKYFGTDWRERAVGRRIRIDNREDFTVTGVFRDIPGNSSLQFDFVLPMDAHVRQQNFANLNNWSNSSLIPVL